MPGRAGGPVDFEWTYEEAAWGAAAPVTSEGPHRSWIRGVRVCLE
ncbi:hypothetical protein [Streptomyces sp. 35G-GA-8]|nr:hypothetical protein [Streptomyces sp. 35G-GA-8]